ncbi:MAG TPA: asparagine synthase (glutamine-hydrolyzing) [Gemmatimonadaceae bacterium]
MCGIAGILSYRGNVGVWRGEMLHSMELMARRGPDAAGIWADDCCLLGFRRLSILDLSEAGNQPMLTRDGRYALVFNGELYNFREIRKSLEQRGVSFRSTGDAEVVLYALAMDGVGALEQFNGMFALAFYDGLEQRLLTACDHAGIKPLYLLRHPDGVLFASQYDQVLSHPWAREKKVSEAALGLYLRLGYIPPPFGLVESSAAGEAGSWVSFGADGTVRDGRYFEFPRNPEAELCGDAALEAVDAAVTSAVRRQLVSDVPLGVFLSGGIDSPLVAAKAQAAEGTPLPAFTLGTDGDALDESIDAARYAEALGLNHTIRHIVPSEVVSLLDDVVTAYNEPHDDFSIFPTLLISRIAREHVKVVLAGDGGDDLFWGYPGRMLGPLRESEWPLRSAITRAARSSLKALRGEDAVAASRRIGDEQLRLQAFVNLRDLAGLFPLLPEMPAEFTLFEFGNTDTLATWMRWNEYSGHLGRVLCKVDRGSMHHSLEVRVPLLDREVVDVAARIDWKSCLDLRSGKGKLPLRASLRRHLPFQTTPKRGFTVPMGDWLRGPLRPVFEDVVLPRREMLGLSLDRRSLERLFRRHLDRRGDSAWLLWRLLSLALWEARHYSHQPR